jgi:hypothetical protein
MLALSPLWGCARGPAPPAQSELRWLKGETHLHSGNSHDSRTPPEVVARWYEAHGFDFAVFTDHNFVTKLPSTDKMLIVPGAELTQNLQACDPPPEDAKGCLLHVNALFANRAGPVVLPPGRSTRRVDLYQRALDEARDLGAIAQLNHPNFAHAADGALITELSRRGLALMEIANQGHDSTNGGDATQASTEAKWDAALTAGANVWGVASDDAHQYTDAEAAEMRARGEEPYTGDRGWIMVHAHKNIDDIRAAIVRGDFYASNGVTLARVERTKDALAIAADGPCHFTFIGAGGKTLAESDGSDAKFALSDAKGGYVRAVVRDAAGRKAWTQPVRVP